MSKLSCDALSDFRAQFHIERLWLNHAAVGVLPRCAAQAMADSAHAQFEANHADDTWYADALRFRTLGASVTGANGPHEVAFVPNTSTGLATIALAGFRGRGWVENEEIVVLDDDFPANYLPWRQLEKYGVRLRRVQTKGHMSGVLTDLICDAITDRTRMVCIPWVHWVTGERVDLAEVGRYCRQVGAWLVVDAIQGIGVLPCEMAKWGVDVMVADGHKWMLGPEGAGLLVVNEDLIPQLPPPIVGWLNRVNPLQFESDHDEPSPNASRFEPGTLNIIGLHGLCASLSLICETGLEHVWAQTDRVCEALREGLEERGMKLVGTRQPRKRSGIVSVTCTQDHTPEYVREHLATHGVYVAERGGCIRFSPHAYHTVEDMERLWEVLPS